MTIFTNQMFCYWLQGYFEISSQPEMTKERIILIQKTLNKVTEEYGSFTAWLSQALSALKENDYHSALLKRFSSIIREELYNIFVHVIDDSYDKPKELLVKVHDGVL